MFLFKKRFLKKIDLETFDSVGDFKSIRSRTVVFISLILHNKKT